MMFRKSGPILRLWLPFAHMPMGRQANAKTLKKRKRRVCQGLVADYRGRKSNGGKYDLGIGDSKSRGGTALPCGEGKAREN